MKSAKPQIKSLRSILNQLISDSKTRPDQCTQAIWFGTSSYFRKYEQSRLNGNVTPLRTAESSQKHHTLATINWSFFADSQQIFPEEQCAVRLEKTPFILNRLASPEYDVYIFDAYRWKDFCIQDRYIFIEPVSAKQEQIKQFTLKIEINGKIDIWLNDRIKPAGAHTEIEFTPVENLYFLQISMAIKKIDAGIHDGNPHLLFHRISECRSQFPGQLIRFQNDKMNAIHEQLWVRQLEINPDWSTNSVDETNDLSALIKTILLHFGKTEPALTERKDELVSEEWLKLSLVKDADYSIHHKLLPYLNEAELDAGGITQFLQLWWNVYSLPLFSRKLNRKIVQSPQEIALIIMLAMRYRLPFYTLLYDKFMAYHEHVAESGLLVYALFMFSHLQILQSGKALISWPGPRAVENGVQLRHDFSGVKFAYSFFSKKMFSAIHASGQCMFKIDDLMIMTHTLKSGKTTIAAQPVHFQKIDSNALDILSGNISIAFCLTRKAGRLENDNFRLKWLLKKDRFQCTTRRLKQKTELVINGQPATGPQSDHIKTYLYTGKVSPRHNLTVYDQHMRTMGLSIKSGQLNIAGRIIDAQGFFEESVHVIKKRKQQRLGVDSEHFICGRFYYEAPQESVQLAIRHFQFAVPVPKVEHKAWRRFINVSFVHQPQNLLIFLKGFNDHVPEIRTSIKALFGYLPAMRSRSESTAGLTLSLEQSDKNEIVVTDGAQAKIALRAFSVSGLIPVFVSMLLKNIKK